MKSPAALTAAVLSLSLLPTSANARSYDKHHDYARVINVEPIIEQVRYNKPTEHCWDKQVRVQYRRHNDSYTDEIIGAVIGGAIGNATGKNKTNKRVQAAIGAALGATIAHDLSKPSYSNNHYRTERHCEIRQNVEYHEQVSGYRVTYAFQGRTYHTRMSHRPGNRIKVRVQVEPVY